MLLQDDLLPEQGSKLLRASRNLRLGFLALPARTHATHHLADREADRHGAQGVFADHATRSIRQFGGRVQGELLPSRTVGRTRIIQRSTSSTRSSPPDSIATMACSRTFGLA